MDREGLHEKIQRSFRRQRESKKNSSDVFEDMKIGGRKTREQFIEACRQHNFNPVEALIQLAQEEGTSNRERINIAKFVAERIYAKPGTLNTDTVEICWEGFNGRGDPLPSVIPEQIVESTNSVHMRLKLKNGSIIQVKGTDAPDKLRGANPRGVIFSEWSYMDPGAWEVVRPILAENGGWALWLFTPCGKNHGYQILEQAKSSSDWFHSVLTVDEPSPFPRKHLSGNGAPWMRIFFARNIPAIFSPPFPAATTTSR